MGTPPKLGWNRGVVTQEHKKPAISLKRCKIGPRLLWWTNYRKTHTRFRLVPKSTTLDDLERHIQGLPKVLKYPLLSQKRVQIRTSNLAAIFTGSLHSNKSPLKILEKRSVGLSRTAQIFRVPRIISGTGKATKFKFCRNIYRLNRNKSPLKISQKVALVIVRDSWKFLGHPYVWCIARSSLR